MSSRQDFLIITILTLGIYYCSAEELYEGSKCRNFDDTPGECRKIINCPPALQLLRRIKNHNFKRCGFEDFEEIVCCPNSLEDRVHGDKEETQMKAVTRKSKQACDNYMKNRPVTLSYYIIEGEDAVPGEFPFMAALGFYSVPDKLYKFNCGGTLISNRYIVTAAHCIINVQQNELKIARMGTVEVPESVEDPDPKLDYNVKNITIHKDYNWKEKFNDIALVKLAEKVTFTDKILPACLYVKNDDPRRLLVTGWGAVEINGVDKSITLQKAFLNPVPVQDCNQTYLTRSKRKVLNSQICAIDDKSDACTGDSGGPLLAHSNVSSLKLAGITSYGMGCASKTPGVYTRIHTYLDWIEGIVWP